MSVDATEQKESIQMPNELRSYKIARGIKTKF